MQGGQHAAYAVLPATPLAPCCRYPQGCFTEHRLIAVTGRCLSRPCRSSRPDVFGGPPDSRPLEVLQTPKPSNTLFMYYVSSVTLVYSASYFACYHFATRPFLPPAGLSLPPAGSNRCSLACCSLAWLFVTSRSHDASLDYESLSTRTLVRSSRACLRTRRSQSAPHASTSAKKGAEIRPGVRWHYRASSCSICTCSGRLWLTKCVGPHMAAVLQLRSRSSLRGHRRLSPACEAVEDDEKDERGGATTHTATAAAPRGRRAASARATPVLSQKDLRDASAEQRRLHDSTDFLHLTCLTERM